jgi:hypothetical protein
LTEDVVGCVRVEAGIIGAARVEHGPTHPAASIVHLSRVWKLADSRYVKFVNKTIAKIETILKLILTAKDPPAGLVQNYFFLIADKSVTNFLKVLELKVSPNSLPKIPILTVIGYPKSRAKPFLGVVQHQHVNPRRSHRFIHPPDPAYHPPSTGGPPINSLNFAIRYIEFEHRVEFRGGEVAEGANNTY